MNLNSLKNLYYNSPSWIKKIYSKIPMHIREGKDYRKWNTFLLQNSGDEYPLLKLRETLFLAQQHIPYYSAKYSPLGNPGIELNKIEDLKQLPFITKEIVKEHFEELINPEHKNTFYVTTGGSTGEPMKFIQSRNLWGKELAFVHSIFSRIGYTPAALKASFRGAQFSKLQKNKYWHYNPIQNEVQFSPFHLNSETIPYYIKEFNKQKPKYIHGYPSAILNFIRLVADPKKILSNIDGVILISENYQKKDVKEIKDFLGCPVLSFYGHSERLIIAPTIDELCQIYEVDKRYGYFELISEKGENIDEGEQRGEIVGTSFDNLAMPLIRYRTGDYTQLITSKTNKNILFHPVEGRWKNEFIDGKSGEQLTLTAINFHSSHFEGINTYQFIQNDPGKCELVLTANDKISQQQIDSIFKIVNIKIGHAVNLSVKQIETPILTPRGKQLRLIKKSI